MPAVVPGTVPAVPSGVQAGEKQRTEELCISTVAWKRFHGYKNFQRALKIISPGVLQTDESSKAELSKQEGSNASAGQPHSDWA